VWSVLVRHVEICGTRGVYISKTSLNDSMLLVFLLIFVAILIVFVLLNLVDWFSIYIIILNSCLKRV